MATQYGYRGPDIVSNGLVLYLDAGNPNSYQTYFGNTWRDVSGNGNNGTLTNGPTYNTGNGGSIVFDGVDDYVGFSSTTGLNTQYSTVEIWASFTNPSSANTERLFARTNTNAGTFDMQKSGVNKDFFGIIRDSTNTQTLISDNDITSTSWIQYAITYDGSTFILYKNATQENSVSISSTINTGGTFEIRIGARTSAFNDLFFNGKISIARIYNRGISATELLQNYNAQKARFGL